MELNALVQYEGVIQTVIGYAPFLCQQGNHFGFLIKGQESFIHCVGDGVGITVTGNVGIQMSRVCLKGYDHVIVRRFCSFISKCSGGKAECQSAGKHKSY